MILAAQHEHVYCIQDPKHFKKQSYTPENQHDIGKSQFSIGNTSSNGGCFVVMLVFGGGGGGGKESQDQILQVRAKDHITMVFYLGVILIIVGRNSKAFQLVDLLKWIWNKRHHPQLESKTLEKKQL